MSPAALHDPDCAKAGALAANPLVEWILGEGWDAPALPELVRALCERMLALGMPLCRMKLHVRILHPQYLGTSYTWTRGRTAIEEFNVTYAVLNDERYRSSPFKAIFDDGVGAVRRRLDIPGIALDYPLLEELRAAGATDYVAMPLIFTDARRNAITFAADRPGGFATGELDTIYAMLPVLARLLEAHALRRTARTILETYLGRVSGERVLKGLVRRGHGEDIDAVIWFSDLRSSTPLADVLPRPVFLELLNSYFEAMAGPVLAHGGEVLRYIGDALLAIFPLGSASTTSAIPPLDPAAACSRALAAGREAIARMAALNRTRIAKGETPLRFGIGLHIGAVMYGNIGVDERLEFTVIGAAANEAARLEAICKTLDRPLVLSAELARLVEEPLLSLGVHALRGVREPHEVLTLAKL